MTARIESEQRGELLLVRLRGSIGFDVSDWQLRDDLVALLRGHVSGGGTHLLIDLSEASYAYGSSLELGASPLVQKEIVGATRVAVVLGANTPARTQFRVTRLDRLLDCFETEAEALDFLRSHAPMKNGAAPDHEFWAAMGPEVGPETCKREGCDHLHVKLSRFCKRHHYEMVRGSAYVQETDA